MTWLQQKYIGLMSNRFDRFKQKTPTSYNLRCPECGDSKKNKFKARGYLYCKKGEWFYDCKNCSYSTNFNSFLKKFCPELYEEYCLESLREKSGGSAKLAFSNTITTEVEPVDHPTENPLKKLKKISQLHHTHTAKSYVDGRKIPTKYQAKMYYCPDFTAWVNSQIPDKLKETDFKDKRIIIPFIDKKGRMIGFQGRALNPKALRYITIMLDGDSPKIYGLDSVDWSKQVYVTEGPIDSMFLDNSLAASGSDIPSVLNRYGVSDPSKVTIVFDNERRNKQLLKIMENAISSNYNVCFWPRGILEKDINDMVLARGNTALMDIKMIIDMNSYNGLRAHMALAEYTK